METLNEIKIKLYQYFAGNNLLILPDDKLKIIPISEFPELEAAAVISSLEDFEKSGIVRKINYEDKVIFEEVKNGKSRGHPENIKKTGYILEKNLASYSQTVEIPGDLAALLSKITNMAQTSQSKFISNPLSISSYEIETAAILCDEFLKREQLRLNN